MRIKIRRVKTGWYFLFVARNGRTLCHSEVYRTYGACRKTVMLMRDKMASAPIGVERG